MKKLTLLLVFMLTFLGSIFSQYSSMGTEFEFVFLQNRTMPDGTAPLPYLHEVNLYIYITNTSQNTSYINLTYNGNGNLLYKINNGTPVPGPSVYFSTNPGQTTVIQIISNEPLIQNCDNNYIPDMRPFQMMGNNTIQKKEFKITSSEPVSVFAESSQPHSRDGSLILPNSILGTEYYIVSYKPDPVSTASCQNTYGSLQGGGPSEFAILATEDYTEITITFPSNITYLYTNMSSNFVIPNSNHQYTITLNEGEAIQFQSDGYELTGTNIKSNKKIAVFAGNMAVGLPFDSVTFDHLYEELFPVNTWGCKFITVPLKTPYNDNFYTDIYKIISQADNTKIKLNGQILQSDGNDIVLNSGEYLEFIQNQVYKNGDYNTPLTNVNPIFNQNVPNLIEGANDTYNPLIQVVLFNSSCGVNGLSSSCPDDKNKIDPFMIILSPLEQSITTTIFSVAPELPYTLGYPDNCNGENNNNYYVLSIPKKEDYLTIITKTTETDFIKIDDLNGNIYPVSNLPLSNSTTQIPSLEVNWTQISGTDYSYAIVNVSNDDQSNNGNGSVATTPINSTAVPYKVYDDNVNGKGFNAYLYGYNSRESYGYAAGVNLQPITNITDTTICYGDAIELHAFGGDSEDSYEWLNSDGSTPTTLSCTNCPNPIAFPTQTTSYTVHISNDEFCDRYQTVTIHVKECCSAEVDPTYTHINNDIIINTNTIWEGKYYINDNVTVTVNNGAILDITNVDVVFGDCASIVFVDGASLRANNSVFRPCNIEDTWKGLIFQDKGKYDNIINECTFKNAEVALYFKNQADGVISDNLFSNCNYAIRIENQHTTFDHPISGNRFVFDNFLPDFSGCYNFVNNINFYGIFAYNSRLSSIAHNNFISNKDEGKYNINIYGVKLVKSGSLISENIFTNIDFGIFQQLPLPSYILNNSFEIVSLSHLNDYPITIENNSGIGLNSIVNIEGNDFNNPFESLKQTSNCISIHNSTNVKVVNNLIYGFNTGINLTNDSRIKVYNNTIKHCKKFGVIVQSTENSKSSHNSISCNEIYLSNYNKSFGIYIYNSTKDSIISNCIFDANIGIYTGTTSTDNDISFIRNNFLYNYVKAGIYNNNYTGNIGDDNLPGLNTFWSNTNSYDIYSNVDILCENNFGIYNVSSNVNVVQTSDDLIYYSTTNCAHQIPGYTTEDELLHPENLNTRYNCNIIPNSSVVVTERANTTSLNENFQDSINKYINNKFELLTTIIPYIDNKDEFYSIISQYNLTDSENVILKCKYNLFQNNFIEALSEINKISNTNLITNTLKKFIEMNYYINNDIDTTLEIPIDTSNFNVANFLVTLHTLQNDTILRYLYKKPNPKIEFNSQMIKINNVNIKTYPIPIKDVLNIEYILPGKQAYSVQIVNIFGKVIKKEKINPGYGKITINFDNIPNGIYVLIINDNKSQVFSKKIIKS